MFDSITHVKQRAFLAAYAQLGNVKRSAEIAEISRELHYDWKAQSSEYAAAFAQATKMAGDIFEDEATRRAVNGVESLVLYKGEPVLVDGQPLLRVKYSDKLLDKLLTGAKPEKYSTKHVAHDHEHRHTHALDLSSLTDQELDALDRILNKARIDGDARDDRDGAPASEPPQD